MGVADPTPDLLSVRDTVLAEDFDAPWTASEWNALYRTGTPVTYHPVLPPVAGIDPVDTQTRSEAWELGSGEAVVKVEGRAGGVALSHLVVRREPPDTHRE